MENTEENKTKNLSWLQILKAIRYFLDKDKYKTVLCFMTLLAAYFYDLVPIYFVGKIVDFFTTYETGQSLSLFYFYSLFIGITWILASFVRLYSKRYINITSHHARARARIWGFERLTEFSLSWHNKENTGNKLQRIFTGADSVRNFMSILRKDLLKFAANIVGVITVFIFTDWKLSLLIIVYFIIFLYIEFIFSKKILFLSNEFNQLNQSAGGAYMESAGNMLSIKALGGEKGVIDRVFSKETFSRDISVKKVEANNLKWRLVQIMTGITLCIFLLITGKAFLTNIISIGMILVLFAYFDKFIRALGDLSELYTDLIDVRSDLSHMMPIFEETEFIKTGNESFPKDWQKIEIKDAVMNYDSEQVGLKNFTLSLERNTKKGVAGLSGSGKSTLAKIILGLYALKSGEFKIGKQGDMKNYYDIAHNETLSQITVVLQETELFNLSLRDNITMMREEDKDLLNKAVEISQLTEVINRLPEGLDSLIGEKGYMLSGGERQRLGIARAIYKNAPIIILDEATSSLDSDTESKVMEKLLGDYGKDKTFLIIAHRLGTLKYADKIVVMERGKGVEEGSYEELMEDKNSVFYKLNKDKSQKEVIEKVSK